MSNNFSRNHTGEIREIMCKDHVISSFVFFDILLLFTYWFGLYLFSRGETEYLSNLAEKVGSCDCHVMVMLCVFAGVYQTGRARTNNHEQQENDKHNSVCLHATITHT